MAYQVAEALAARAVETIAAMLAPSELDHRARFRVGRTTMTWEEIDANVQRRIVCAHEAGHALVAAHDSAPFPSVGVARSGDFGMLDGNHLANVLDSLDDAHPQVAQLAYLSAIRIILAGGAAELLFLKEEYGAREINGDGGAIKWFTLGASHDMRTAIGLAHLAFPTEPKRAVNALRRCRRDVHLLLASSVGSSALRATLEALDLEGKLSGEVVGRILRRAQAHSKRRRRPAKARRTSAR